MRELWVSKDTGEISTAKLWRNVAYLVGTYLVIRLGDYGGDPVGLFSSRVRLGTRLASYYGQVSRSGK